MLNLILSFIRLALAKFMYLFVCLFGALLLLVGYLSPQAEEVLIALKQPASSVRVNICIHIVISQPGGCVACAHLCTRLVGQAGMTYKGE